MSGPQQHIVILRGHATAFGPFDHHGDAARFAAYLTQEVDPADVLPLCSPVRDLLNWREHVLLAPRTPTEPTQ